jgi:hypothetical protein
VVFPFASALFTLEALLRLLTSDEKLEMNGDGGSVEGPERCSWSDEFPLVRWPIFLVSAELTASGVGSTFGFDSVGVRGVADAFNSLLSGEMLAVRRFLNRFSSSGLTKGTESLFLSSA